MMTEDKQTVVPATFMGNEHEVRNDQIRKAHLRVKKLKEDKTREVSAHDEEIDKAEVAMDEAVASPMPGTIEGHKAWRKAVKTEWMRYKAEVAERAQTMKSYNDKIKEARKTRDTLIENADQLNMFAKPADDAEKPAKKTVKRIPKKDRITMPTCPNCSTDASVDEAGVDDRDKGSHYCAACGEFFSVAPGKSL